MNRIFSILISLYLSLTASSQSCLPEGIQFNNQSQIDSFQVNYPNCTIIEGGVVIGGDVTNLIGLNCITNIGGSLTIQLTNALPNLNGLSGLTSVGGYLFIAQNSMLNSLSGLDSLNSIGSGFEIAENEILTDLSGLEGLTYINGTLRIDFNNSLTSITGLSNITAASISSLYIYNNAALTSCAAQSICDFLASPNGSVNIYDNAIGCDSPPEIANECGLTLPCLPFGNYIFTKQDDITNFQTDYPGCTFLSGYVLISGSDIYNLEGLNIIDSVCSSICVSGNPILTSLSGLDNISGSSISDLIIKYNSLLSYCNVQSICDYLTSPNGLVWIFYNDIGCNSQAEIETECSVGIEDFRISSKLFNVYPNPSSTHVFIELLSDTIIKNTHVTLCDLGGRILLNKPIYNHINSLDISNFCQGIYYLEICNDYNLEIFKIIVNKY